tara:strand:+ start:824 stop:2026 length:1203 start_codon:yes stop_codon:yes gene_type:complete
MTDDVLLFEGLKVLDVGSWIAGPVAATMLADRGAEVLKIEEPVVGDGYRGYATLGFTPTADVNYTWAMDARNKRSLSLNLKTDAGMDILKKLIGDCDVYVSNQPLALRRLLNLDYEDIKALNPRMIYASLTPFGEAGPDSDNEAFDLVAYWNRSGLLNHMRPDGHEPIQAMAGMGDHPTAVALYASIVTALLQRERTGKGCMVHTSLLANGLWSSSCYTQAQIAGADFSTLASQRLTGAVYETADGRWLQLSMVRGEEEFDRLLIAIEAFDILGDDKYATLDAKMVHRDELTTRLREIFLQRSSDDWLRLLKEEHALNVERVVTFEEVQNDPHLPLNNMVSRPVEDVGIDYIINDPVNVEGVKKVGARHAPGHGEHSAEVLIEMGYGEAEIRSLKEQGII